MILRLLFSGLIAFAPLRDGQGVWVVLPTDPSHYAVIRVSESNCCEGDRAPDFWVSKTLSGPREAVFVIREVDVSFEIDSVEPFSIVRGRRGNNLKKPCLPGESSCQGNPHSYLEQKSDFGWVLDVPSVVPGVEKINPNCLTIPLNEGPFEIAGLRLGPCKAIARLSLGKGMLRTVQLEGDEGASEIDPSKVDTFTVERLSPVQPEQEERAVAKKVELIVGSIMKTPSIILTSWGREQKVQKIALKPDSAGMISVTIEHLPLPDIITPGFMTRSSMAMVEGQDHFRAFYDLSMWVPPAELRPRVNKQRRSSSGGQIQLFPHANERICPMATFQVN